MSEEKEVESTSHHGYGETHPKSEEAVVKAGQEADELEGQHGSDTASDGK